MTYCVGCAAYLGLDAIDCDGFCYGCANPDTKETQSIVGIFRDLVNWASEKLKSAKSGKATDAQVRHNLMAEYLRSKPRVSTLN